MTIKRRLFNGYMATGLVAGSTIGFVASRFGGTEDKPRELLTPVDALREAAVAARSGGLRRSVSRDDCWS